MKNSPSNSSLTVAKNDAAPTTIATTRSVVTGSTSASHTHSHQTSRSSLDEQAKQMTKEYKGIDLYRLLNPLGRGESGATRFFVYKMLNLRVLTAAFISVVVIVTAAAIMTTLIIAQGVMLDQTLVILNQSLSGRVLSVLQQGLLMPPSLVSATVSSLIESLGTRPTIAQLEKITYGFAKNFKSSLVGAYCLVNQPAEGAAGFFTDDATRGIYEFKVDSGNTSYGMYDIADTITGQAESTPFAHGGFVPSTRPYFIKSSSFPRGSLVYTDAYVGVSSSGPLVYFTLTTPLYYNNTFYGVSAVDFTTHSLTNFLQDKQQIDVGNNGLVVIMNKKRQVIALSNANIPNVQKAADGSMSLIYAKDSSNDVVKSIDAYLVSQNPSDATSFTLTVAGNKYYARYNRLQVTTTEDTYWQTVVLTAYVDYSTLIATSVPIAVAISVLFVGTSIILGLIYSFVISRTLQRLSALMTAAADMRIEGIEFESKALSSIGEVRKIQLSFYWLIQNLKQYKAFLPQSVIDQIDMQLASRMSFSGEPGVKSATNLMDQHAPTTNTNDETSSNGTSSSHGKKSEHSSRVQKRGNRVAPLGAGGHAHAGSSRFELGLHTCDISVVSVRITNMQELTERLHGEVVVDIYRQVVDIASDCSSGGSLLPLEPGHLLLGFNTILPNQQHATMACRAALQIQSRINEMTAHLSSGITPTVTICLATGLGCKGNLGSDKIRNFSLVGQVIHTLSVLDKFSEAMKLFGKVVVPQISKPTKNAFRTLPIAFVNVSSPSSSRQTLVEAYELVEERKKTTQDGEWMYELQQKEQAEKDQKEMDAHKSFHSLKNATLQSQHQILKSLLAKFPDCPDIAHVRELVEKGGSVSLTLHEAHITHTSGTPGSDMKLENA